jgi:hypothetical protein
MIYAISRVRLPVTTGRFCHLNCFCGKHKGRLGRPPLTSNN